MPDEEWGERVHAVVVPAPGAAPTTEELREHVKLLVAGYKAPRTVEFRDAPCPSPARARSSSATYARNTGRRTSAESPEDAALLGVTR